MLKLTNIKKSFVKNNEIINILNDFSLTVDKGEFVAVRGTSGSGKSTLLFVIGSLLTPDSGTVLINEINPYNLNPENRAIFRAQNIGFIFQQFHLLPYLNVLENVLTANLVVKNNKAEENAAELLEKINLKHRLNHVPAELSVGERQRVALARAILNKPKLILADEPTGNLDPENSKIILDFLKEYAADGNTVIMVTHDERATKSANKVITL